MVNVPPAYAGGFFYGATLVKNNKKWPVVCEYWRVPASF